jgi:threonine dehydratase
MFPASRTPLVRLTNLFPERQVYAKCEFLGLGGSFKIRGTTHLLQHLNRKGQSRLLVVPSMGNTALGAAVGARRLGFTMLGVVPQSISRAKDERLQALGVELVKVAGGGSDLLNTAKQISQERDGYFVHPHLDPLWTDGYQTIAAEVFEELPQCRTLVLPVGGGGLLMGLTEYLLQHPSSVKLVGCEAYNFPTYTSYNHTRSTTIADGLLLDVPHPPVQQRINDFDVDMVLVKDPDIRCALAGLYVKQGLVVEPSSAITVAYLQHCLGTLDDPVCVILTGENITREDFLHLIAVEAAT